MRSRGLLLLGVATLPLTACVLDWGSLREPDDASADATGADVRADAPRDTSTFNEAGWPADADNTDATADADVDAADASADVTDDVADSSSPDAAADSGADAAADAGIDAGVDAGVDAGIDAGVDAGVDASADAGADAHDAAPACQYTFSGTLATWNLANQPGNEASAPATSSAAGLVAGAISRSSALVAASGLNSINSSSWSLGALDPTRYYTFTLTPPSGCTLSISGASLDTKASSTGPASGAVATSADSFTATSAFTPNTVTSVSLSVTAAAGAVELRAYGYSATSTAGTLRIQNTMTVTGSLQ